MYKLLYVDFYIKNLPFNLNYIKTRFEVDLTKNLQEMGWGEVT